MNERAEMIREAKRLARKLKRPWSVRPAQWAVMQDVLVELANHVPEVRPTQKGLAEKLGTYRAAIQRALDAAEANGLIERRVHDSFHGQWDGTEYRLLWWPGHTQVSGGSSGSTVRQAESRSMTQNVVIPVTHIESRSMTQGESLNGGSTNRRRNGSQHTHSECVIDGDPADDADNHLPETQKVKPNDYPEPCVVCHSPVNSGEGRVQRDPFGKWRAVHLGCYGKPASVMSRQEWEHDENKRSMQTYVPPQAR
jgi:hypothetical protein